ncbi:MAG: hypothetical protein AAB664_01455, partial [Patescibacteria group bacterium]
MLKKSLILSLLIAAAISPVLPKAFAEIIAWRLPIVDRVFDHETFRVDRLALPITVSDPMKRNRIAYVSNTSTKCADPGICDKIDLSILMNGKIQTINGVDQQFLNPSFAVAQKGKFVYFTKSTDANKWIDVSFVDPNTGEIYPLTSIVRKANELSFVSLSTSGDRTYASLIQTDVKTKRVTSALLAKSNDGAYEERGIDSVLNAPFQQIADAYNDQVLVKFQFPSGNKQLWLINPKTQVMSAIPNTWTEPQGDILFAHFLSNGTVVYFQNYLMYTFNPFLKDAVPVMHTTLNWNMPTSQAVKIQGNQMEWIDDKNIAWKLQEDGKVIKNNVQKDPAFTMTDSIGVVSVGTDAQGNILLKNASNDVSIKLGYGTSPVLTDARHVIWKGTDGMIYQATLSVLLSMEKSESVGVSYANPNGFAVGTRVKAIGNPRVYMVGTDGNLHWIVSETV